MYAKVFYQIFESSISEDYVVRHVFMDLLVLADEDGVIDKTPQSISRITNVPLDIVLRGIKVLSEPDRDSRGKSEEGRRLVLIDDHRDWGWRVVNYAKYRAIRDEEARRIANRSYKREQRARQREEAIAAAAAKEKRRKPKPKAETPPPGAPAPEDTPAEILTALTPLVLPEDGYPARLLKACREKSADVTVHEIVFWIGEVVHRVQAPTSEVAPRGRAAYVFRSVVNNLGGSAYHKAQEVEQERAQKFLKGAIPIKLAHKMWEELGIAHEPSDVDVLAQTISFEAKEAKVEPAEFYGVLLALAQSAKERGTTINKFWFKDREYAKEEGNGRSGKAKQGVVSARLKDTRIAIAEAAIKRGWYTPDSPNGEVGEEVAGRRERRID